MKFFTKEVQIALVAILGIVILFFGMQFLKGLSLFSNKVQYKVSFADISGLSTSAPVYANGYKVGMVEKIDYDFEKPSDVVVTIGVDKNMKLPKDTKAEITSDLMGNVKLVLKLGNYAAGMLAVGDTFRGMQQQGLLSKAGDLMPQVEMLLPKLDSILSSVNALLADPALKNSLGNIETITSNLTTTTNELHILSASLNRQLPALVGKADGVMENTQTLTSNLSQLDVAATMQRVNATLDNVQQMTERLNSNDGTLGLLMRDPSLYRNLNATMQHADSLVIDLKQHPKRYVHFSVFGRKDK